MSRTPPQLVRGRPFSRLFSLLSLSFFGVSTPPGIGGSALRRLATAAQHAQATDRLHNDTARVSGDLAHT